MGERDTMTGADQDRREARAVDQHGAAEDVTRTAGGSNNLHRLYAEQGQSVRSGQTLARIEGGGLQDVYLSARAGLTSASNNADIARRELARSEKLLAAGAIAERDIEQARRGAIAANAALADAQARLATARKQVGNTVIGAPISGIVSDRPISAGDVVQAGAHLFTVVDPSSMRLEGSVPAEQLSQVRLGAPVTTPFTPAPPSS